MKIEVPEKQNCDDNIKNANSQSQECSVQVRDSGQHESKNERRYENIEPLHFPAMRVYKFSLQNGIDKICMDSYDWIC